MNRYTQLSTTQFNPLSMEELSILPAMMRQRHDAANLEMEKRRADLNAFAISSPEYAQEAQALIAQMNKGIDDLSSSLASNGYNSLTRANLSSMNRDYQQLVSPTGRLGQMTNAEKLNAERYKEHMEAAQKAGHSTEDAMRNWALNKKNYTGYDNEGNITAINSLGAPKYVNMMSDLKDIKGILGESQRRVDRAGGGDIQIRNDGSAWVVNKSGSVQRITNDPQLNQALELLKTKWLSPDGEGFRSAMYQGKNLNNIISELNAGINSMRVDKIIDNVNYSGSLSGYKNPKDGDGDGNEGPYGGNFMNTNNSYNFTASKYGDLKSTKKALADLGQDFSKMTEEQRETHEILSNRVREYELALVNNKEYQEATKYINNAKKELNNNKSALNSGSKTDKSGNLVIPKNMQSTLGEISLAAQSKKDPKLKEMIQTKERIEAETFSNLPNRVSDYTIARSSNTVANRSIEAADSNIYDLLTNADGAIDNNFKVLKISDDEGEMRDVGNLGDTAKENINSLLNNAKSVRVLSTKRDPLTSKISVTLNVATDETNKASLGFWNGNAGGGKNTTVTLEMNTATNNAGVKNILGHLANHYHKYGGDEGKIYASEIMNDSNKRSLNNAFTKGNIAYGDINNITPFLDGDTKIQLNHQLKEEASLRYGLPIEVLNKMEASEYDEIINNLIRDSKNQTLKLY